MSLLRLVCLISMIASGCASSASRQLSSTPESPGEQMILAINEYRVSNGIAPLEENSFVQKAAESHAVYLRTQKAMSHNGPEGAEGPLRRVWKAGGQEEFGKAAENLGCGSSDPRIIVKGWSESEGHRKNLLRTEVSHAGVGYQADSGQSDCPHLWVVVFGGK